MYMLNKIEEIRSLRIQKSLLSEKEAILSRPLLFNLDLIENLYYWFQEILSEQDPPSDIKNVSERKKFLFIVLYLYSPATLAGGKMAVGLRNKLTEVIDVCAKTTISDNCTDLGFLYNRYKTFNEEVNLLYNKLTERLRIAGLSIDPAA